MDHIITYEEYLRDVKKGIVTDLGNSPVTPLLLMLQGKWKTQITMTIWFVLLSAGIKTSAFQISKFRGSITLSIFSLSTLSNYHYWQSPKTRYWRLVRPYQTGIPPARLLALVWAHNSDLLNSYPHYSIKITTLYITFVTYNAVTFIFFDTPNKTYSCIR